MSGSPVKRRKLLSIIEMGGYPNFAPLYNAAGYDVVVKNTMRKAIVYLKKERPEVIVAEFNFQSDFRDRTSSLESLMAVAQRMQGTRVIVFYEREFSTQFERLRARFPIHESLTFPIQENRLKECLSPAE